MATLYIHIGSPKTGTSSLQNFFVLNADTLAKHGLYYPCFDFPFYKEKFKFRRNGDFLVYESQKNGEEKIAEQEAAYRHCFKTIKDNADKYEKILVSDEAIWYRQNHACRENFWQNVVADAKDAGCQVKVIVYLRSQDLYVQSLWNQNVKFYPRVTLSFADYIETDALKNQNLDYYSKLTEIAEVIGKENLIVKSYEKDLFLGEKDKIYKDFLESIGETWYSEYKLPERNANDRLGGNMLEIKRWINQSENYRREQEFFNDPLMAANQMMKKEKVGYFASGAQQAFMEKYVESNEKVAREFLHREDGILFYDKADELPTWQLNQESMCEDIVKFFAEAIISERNNRSDEINQLKEAIKYLEKQNKDFEKRISRLERIHNNKPLIRLKHFIFRLLGKE